MNSASFTVLLFQYPWCQLFPILKAIKQFGVTARQRDHTSVDKHIFDIRPGFENISVGYNHICYFTDIERTHLVGNAKYLSRK